MSTKEKEVKKPEPKEVKQPVRKPGHPDQTDNEPEDKEVKRDQRDGAFGEPQYR